MSVFSCVFSSYYLQEWPQTTLFAVFFVAERAFAVLRGGLKVAQSDGTYTGFCTFLPQNPVYWDGFKLCTLQSGHKAPLILVFPGLRLIPCYLSFTPSSLKSQRISKVLTHCDMEACLKCLDICRIHRSQCLSILPLAHVTKGSGAGRVRDAFNVDAKNFYIEHCLKAVLVHNSRSLP